MYLGHVKVLRVCFVVKTLYRKRTVIWPFTFTQLYGLYLPQSAKNKDTKDIQLDNTYLYGDEDSNYFDKMFPILMSFFVFLFVFLISGIALLRERTTGTIERVLATPIKRSEIVLVT